jgi:hypothetical protein
MSEVLRPQGIERPLSKSTMLSRVGSMAVQQEPFARSGDVAFRSSVPTLLDPLAPNSATTLRLRNYCKIQPTADVLAEVFPIASYKTSI